MSLALYRKYRPQRFADIIGQPHIVSLLVNSLLSNKTHHAYLFIGSRGTGKTSTARILAKALNCSKRDPKTGEPCNTCSICVGITEGSYMDLLEIDAASNRGIDEIRDLREKIKLSPTEGKYKVYIIDEVHMLTTEAFNALLKTLEEPPAHALFVLCTTDPQKLPATIVSRCLKMEFRRPEVSDLTSKLGDIATREGVTLTSEVLSAVAEVAGGAFRDAEVLLEKVLSELGDSVVSATPEQIKTLLGVGNKDSVVAFLTAVLEKQTGVAFEWLDQYVRQGGDPKLLNITILEFVRYMLLVKLGMGEVLVKKEVSPVVYTFLQSTSSKMEKATIISMYTIFTQSLEHVRISPIPVFPLEVALAQLSLDSREEAPAPVKSTPKAEVPPTEPPKKVETPPKPVVMEVVEVTTAPATEAPSTPPEETPVATEVTVESEARNSTDVLLDEIRFKWPEVTKIVKTTNSSLYAVLTSCELKEYDGTILTIAVPYSFHKDRLEESKNRKVVEKVLGELIGADIKIRGTLGERKKRDMSLVDIQNIEPVSETEMIDNALDIFNSGLKG